MLCKNYKPGIAESSPKMPIGIPTLLACVIMLLSCKVTWGQLESEEFGIVSQSALALTLFEADSAAEAVVLFDKCKVYVDQASHTRGTTYDRHIRIKILREGALERANFSFILSNDARLNNIKASTYNLEGVRIIRTDMSEESVVKQKYNKYFKKVVFTLPMVKVGSVFEITYRYVDEFAYLPSWTFQDDIPTLKSEYILESPVPFMFYIQGSLKPIEYETKSRSRRGKWLMLNVPAFKGEPDMPNDDFYVSRISFVTEGDSWGLINQDFEKRGFEKNLIRYNDFFKNFAKQISAAVPDSTEKIKAISDFVKKNIGWNGIEDIYPDMPDEIVKNKQGTSGDINMVLAAMLHYIGFKVNFVLLSTRDHGMLREDFPAWRQFNYVICRVKVKNGYKLLDATEKPLPFDVLPKRCYNHRGFVIAKKGHQWISIEPSLKEKVQASASLNVDGEDLVGQLTRTHFEYSAFIARSDYFTKSDDRYFTEAAAGHPWTVARREASHTGDPLVPFKEVYALRIHNHVFRTENSIFVNPFVALWAEKNPFREGVRNFPIDLPFPYEKTMLCNIAIPPGYGLAQVPENKIFAMKDNAVRCTFNFTEANGNLVVTTKLQFNKTFFYPDEYPDLREFFARIIAKKTENIELTKR